MRKSSTQKKFLGNPINLLMDEEIEGPRVISTGNFDLDYRILTIGGVPRGIITEFFGAEQSGKSTLALSVIANAQRAGLRCALLETETFVRTPEGKKWAKALGVNLAPEWLTYWNEVGPAESLLRGLLDVMKSGEYGVVVLDSLPFLRTQSQMDAYGGRDADSQGRIADLANTLTFFAPALALEAYNNQVAFIVTNQVRVSITPASPMEARMSAMTKAARGTIRTPGGRAWRHACSLRLFFQRTGALFEGDELVGTQAEALLVKSRVSPPLRRTGKDCPEIRFYFDGRVMDEPATLLDYALAYQLIQQKGAHYFLPDGQRFHGRDALRAACDNPTFLDWLREATLAIARANPSGEMQAVAAEEDQVVT